MKNFKVKMVETTEYAIDVICKTEEEAKLIAEKSYFDLKLSVAKK